MNGFTFLVVERKRCMKEYETLTLGPMVWYQQFEYAVGHWLQKAAEHVFGCVLCCPGCFSLFRGSALMDDNVMKMYTTKPTEARHYIQFEQGIFYSNAPILDVL